MVIEPDTKEYIQDFGGCILTENGEPGITELMNTYFQAVSDCDMDTFVKLFTHRIRVRKNTTVRNLKNRSSTFPGTRM